MSECTGCRGLEDIKARMVIVTQLYYHQNGLAPRSHNYQFVRELGLGEFREIIIDISEWQKLTNAEDVGTVVVKNFGPGVVELGNPEPFAVVLPKEAFQYQPKDIRKVMIHSLTKARCHILLYPG